MAGNVTTINGSSYATYDNANKLSTIQSKSVTHNTHGDLTTIAATSPLTFKQIDWNSKAKATRVYETGGNWVDYNYLYDGKRYWGKTNAASNKTYYIFSGDTLIGELVGGSPTVAYTWGADGLVSKRNLSTNTSSWYEFGPQGETRKLTNSSGTSTDTYYYNAYGALLSSTGTTVNPYRYGGKYGYYTETFSGLILATQRWYSPQTMRWVSRDPIGYDGGVNLYEYVDNRPLIYTDPTGLAPSEDQSQNGDYIQCLASCIEEKDPLNTVEKGAFYLLGGPVPKSWLSVRRGLDVNNAARITTFPSYFSLGMGVGNIWRMSGRVNFYGFLFYGHYMLGTEIGCAFQCHNQDSKEKKQCGHE